MIKGQIKRHWLSFGYAFAGLYFILASQPNFVVHFLAALLAIGLGLFFKLGSGEWLALVAAIFLVFVTEALNTGLELVTDALKEHKKTERDDFYIALAKDVSAAAVLLSAVNAVVVGLIIFLPRIFK